ncbi:MAG: DUF3095 family protein, partial [Gammaproteobacteria bacterium]|nr:DUF3095 family protein [Gammaproteobacteria bacterium]
GEDSTCRPVTESGLSLTFNAEKLGLETDLKTYNKSIISRYILLNVIRLQNLLGLILMKFKLNIADIPWGRYKPDLIHNTDFKKFDGTLRLVISGNTAQRNQLEKYLKNKNKQNLCVYGIHVSDSAYITCLINNRAGNHFHFVDSADGGYAAASIQFKKQLNEMS